MSIITKAAVAVPGQDGYEIREIVVDGPQAGEVLVRMVASGLCHTDASVKEFWGAAPGARPIVLGHEGAGVVERVGSAVTRVKPGDRVLLTFNSCGACVNCLAGHPAYCHRFGELNMNPAGAVRADGTSGLATTEGEPLAGAFFGQSSLGGYALAQERNVVVVEVDSDDELAALAPLGCGIQTGAGAVLNELRPGPGSTVAVFGSGAVGLAALMAAVLTPAARVVAIDIVPSRLELARELGATHTIDSAGTDVVAALRAISPGGVQVAVETTGVPAVQARAVEALAPRGTLGLIGARIGADFTAPVQTLLEGRRVHGIVEGDSDITGFIPALVAYVRAGRMPLEKLVKEYRLEDIDQAAADSRDGSTVKPVLRF
ncbi:NAD(P)-dependent alcohol dehydrogenase [Streptomyces sp. NPDC001787]|uniref:NAD(P)-dependent alcohol dehydrogenase n=1 Tax=Streptomyces sp. NPDC001787 TaxID=3154523 RepID=UPI0033260897